MSNSIQSILIPHNFDFCQITQSIIKDFRDIDSIKIKLANHFIQSKKFNYIYVNSQNFWVSTNNNNGQNILKNIIQNNNVMTMIHMYYSYFVAYLRIKLTEVDYTSTERGVKKLIRKLKLLKKFFENEKFKIDMFSVIKAIRRREHCLVFFSNNL